MNDQLEKIDAAWAWSPYQPSPERPWNLARAAHLLRRAGFGANWNELQAAVDRAPEEVASQLVAGTEPDSFRREVDELAQAMVNTGDVRNLASVWLYRMLATPRPLLEKMTLFWHGHFATSAAKVDDVTLMLNQNRLLRQHALGQFEPLVQGISRDPAMLIYLDSTTNRKAHPNENYAREILELFCLGEGHYTEQDIQELARCFTGWQVKRKKFRFNRYQHDFGTKTIFGHKGELGGEDAVRIVLDQPAASRFIARKLIRYFVFDEPTPSPALVEPLAGQLRDNDFQFAPVVQRILGSQLFFSEHAMARKIRSPMEFACGLLRCLEGTTDTFRLAEQLADLGQSVYFPPNVKGWDGGRTWINSSTLIGRANLVHGLLHEGKTRFAKGSLTELVESHAIDGPDETVDWLCQLLLAVPPPNGTRDRLVQLLASPGGDQEQRIANVIHAMGTLPEFQLG